MSAAAATLAAVLTALRPGSAESLYDESSLRASAFDRVAFEATFAAVGRRLGPAPVGTAHEISDDAGHRWSLAGRGLDEVGRALLLVEGVARVPANEQVAWIDDCWRAGALRERTALLRALALLPAPERFVAVAIDACRASTQPIFEAIACENPYPAAHFPEASFNQLVLKAVFTEVALARILGLDARRTPELARMASDYASERRAAGRPVPADLAYLATVTTR